MKFSFELQIEFQNKHTMIIKYNNTIECVVRFSISLQNNRNNKHIVCD